MSKRPWIFFDLDDTLWDFSSASLKSLRFIYDTEKKVRDLFVDFDSFISCYHDHNAILWDKYSHGEITSDKLKSERWRLTLFPHLLSEETKNEAMKIDSSYLDYLSSLPDIVEGADALLKELSQSNLIGIISNGFAGIQYRKLFSSGLWKHITRCIISEEIGIAKPDKRIFEYAIEETGTSYPPLMIGDNFNTDIIGALRSGWKAVWFCPDGQHSAEDISAKLTQLGEYTGELIGVATNMAQISQIISSTKISS